MDIRLLRRLQVAMPARFGRYGRCRRDAPGGDHSAARDARSTQCGLRLLCCPSRNTRSLCIIRADHCDEHAPASLRFDWTQARSGPSKTDFAALPRGRPEAERTGGLARQRICHRQACRLVVRVAALSRNRERIADYRLGHEPIRSRSQPVADPELDVEFFDLKFHHVKYKIVRFLGQQEVSNLAKIRIVLEADEAVLS